MKKYIYIFSILTLTFYACKEDPKQSSEPIVEQKKERVKVPSFKGDSAFYFVQKQLSFGDRVPGSAGHKACKDWMVDKFKSFGAEVTEQSFEAQFYTGTKATAYNIIAAFNPEHKDRVILSAHWDSRFMGEEDPNEDKKDEPIPGADDAGSGVGVLIEVGRLLAENPIDLGVDIILWDAEDQGQRGGGVGADITWCLGSQYWSRNKHIKKYKAKYGINLDMVGAKNPRFGKEGFSEKYAPRTLNKVWKLAQALGHSDMFIDERTPAITDDHRMVSELAGIPMIDIINQPKTKNGFVPHWHTHDDNLDIINARTLKVVGQVVTATIYKESDGSIKVFEK